MAGITLTFKLLHEFSSSKTCFESQNVQTVFVDKIKINQNILKS